MRRGPALLLASLAGAACARSGLAELRGTELLVEIALSDAPALRVVAAAKQPSMSGDRCVLAAPAATATFNGVALERLRGVYAGGDLTYDRDCLLELAFPGGPIPPAARAASSGVLVIRDGRTRWVVTVPDAFTPRRLALEGSEARLTRGQPVTLRWSPATDRLTDRGIGIGVRPRGHDVELARTIPDVVVAGDRLSFTVPRELPASWNGSIELVFLGTALVAPAVSACPVAACAVSLIFSVEPVVATLQ